METPITVLERHFDTELSDETLPFFAEQSHESWHDFALEYTRYAQAFADVNRGRLKRSEDELAPYLFEHLTYGERIGFPTGWSDARADQLIDALKRILLFHHRVYIPDWFLWLLDLVRFPSDVEERRRSHLTAVLSYLRVLAILKPLFDGGALNFIPTEALPKPFANAVAFDGDPAWLQACSAELGMAPEAAQFQLDRLLTYHFNALGLGVDLLFPNDISERLYRGVARNAVAHGQGKVRDSLVAMQRIPMPGLGRVELRDLVRLRETDDGFQKWRDEMTQLFYMERAERGRIAEAPEEFAEFAAARLRAKRDDVAKSVGKGPLRNIVLEPALSFGGSVLGKLAIGALVPGSGVAVELFAEFVGASLSTAGSTLVDSWQRSTDRPRRESLLRIYSIFEPG